MVITGSYYEHYSFKTNNSEIQKEMTKPFVITFMQRKYFPKQQQSTYFDEKCIKEKSD